jgi:phosphoglycolate phosphatase-like HAD superfamily hydrolase
MLVASNGARDYVEAILETYNFKGLFSSPFLYAEGDLRNKTDIIAGYLSLNPERKLIMIGDRSTDFDAARDNGIPFIGCAFGHAGIDEIRDAEFIIHDFREIPAVLDRIVADNSLELAEKPPAG